MIEVALLILLLVVVALLVALLLRKPPAPAQTVSPEALAAAEERLRNDLARNQSLSAASDKAQREEVRGQLGEMRTLVSEQVPTQVGKAVEARFQADFGKVAVLLDEVRTRLSKLEPLQGGIGALQASVTTFSKMLGNVKARGTWGEFQLGNILKDMLAPGQYEQNVHPNTRSRRVVEYAIVLPGAEDGKRVYLPIDAKFPQEDYARLVQAAEAGDAEAEERAAKALADRVKTFAKDVRDSYIDPPYTTDFAILFLPTEGLYQELTRRADVMDRIRVEDKVLLAGPSTLAALINALQMGFQTLAVQRNTVQVMTLLGKIKKLLATFDEQNEKVAKNLETALKANEENAKRVDQLRKALDKVSTGTEEQDGGKTRRRWQSPAARASSPSCGRN